jgi:YD repeat-containing protein
MNTRTKSLKALRRHGVASWMVALLFLTCVDAFGQTVTTTSPYDGTTPPAIAPGAPDGSYALSGFDTINLYSGKLNVLLPLHSINGRGEAAYNMVLPIQRNWKVLTQYNADGTVSYVPYSDVEPGHSPWGDLPVQYYSVGLVAARSVHAGVDPGQDVVVTCGYSSGVQLVPANTQLLTRLTWKSADGSETELVDIQTGGQPIIQSPNCQNLWTTGYQGVSRGTVFVSTDGSAITFIAQSPVYDSLAEGPTTIGVQGWLFLPNGTRYTTDSSGNVVQIEDRNGNKVSIQGGQSGTVTDPLGRTTTVAYAQFPTGATTAADTIQYNGYSEATRNVTVNYAYLHTALTSGQGSSSIACLFPELSGSTQTLWDPYVVTSVVLPNGKQYTFSYNSYGEVAQVVLPTGGAVQYQWGSIYGAPTATIGTEIGCMQPNSPSGVSGYDMILRRVLSRIVRPSGAAGAVEQWTNYSAAFGNGSQGDTVVTVQHMDSAGQDVLSQENHHLYDNPVNPSGAVAGFDDPTHYTPWQEAKEHHTDLLDASGIPLRSASNTWQQRPCGAYASDMPCWFPGSVSSSSAPAHYTFLSERGTTLSDTSQVSKQMYGYDQYNNRIDTWEYGYGPGQAGALLRHTNRTFLTAGYDTYNASNPTASIHLRSLLQTE